MKFLFTRKLRLKYLFYRYLPIIILSIYVAVLCCIVPILRHLVFSMPKPVGATIGVAFVECVYASILPLIYYACLIHAKKLHELYERYSVGDPRYKNIEQLIKQAKTVIYIFIPIYIMCGILWGFYVYKSIMST